VTARTFFRHFADKREVLFAGSEELERRMVDALSAAPRAAGPMGAIAVALLSVAEPFADRRDYSRRRQAVIAATPELREREFIKMASLVALGGRAGRCGPGLCYAGGSRRPLRTHRLIHLRRPHSNSTDSPGRPRSMVSSGATYW
jgi:AcrR family transcriptional regulator